MHLSLAGSALLMLLLLFALGTFVGVQSGQITRDVDNGQLTDDRRNLQSQWKQMTLFRSLYKRTNCGETCLKDEQCVGACQICVPSQLKCL
uniref:Conotoxin n=2 Tax=Conus betulinus TaxID=89764 RepID=A0A142C1C5_CONBE|nr:conotoxin [Conus betulinus]AMP44746.1 conotoxin [Conus betulinus]